MRLGWGLLAGVLLAGGLAVAARAQVGVPVEPPDPFSVAGPGGGPVRMGRPGRMTEQQRKAMEAERQKKIVADTERLVALALELKAAMQQGAAPTPELAKKLDEMERLAHEVRTKEIQ